MCTNVHTDGGFTRSRGDAETGILVPEVYEVHALTREETAPDRRDPRLGGKADNQKERVGRVWHSGRAVGQGKKAAPRNTVTGIL